MKKTKKKKKKKKEKKKKIKMKTKKKIKEEDQQGEEEQQNTAQDDTQNKTETRAKNHWTPTHQRTAWRGFFWWRLWRWRRPGTPSPSLHGCLRYPRRRHSTRQRKREERNK